jgi:hypothetical protein
MEDPDVRLAAEALGDLRADFITSPRSVNASLMTQADNDGTKQQTQPPQPLLSLLSSSHPILSTAISGSLSAYTTSKTYSPKFRVGAEFLERSIGRPVASVANTVNNVGRKTGVEGGVRWLLERGNSSQTSVPKTDETAEESANKRRRVLEGVASDQEVYSFIRDSQAQQQQQQHQQQPQESPFYHHRAQSQLSFVESLPAYDESRAPTYEISVTRDKDGSQRQQNQHQHQQATTQDQRNWQTRLMISTSGLGAAFSEESLKSLRYCLSALRWANGNLAGLVTALKTILENWDRAQSDGRLESAESFSNQNADGDVTMSDSKPKESEGAGAYTAEKVEKLKEGILGTLKQVIDIVSRYAGGALPEHARYLVRRHLTSLPARFRVATDGGNINSLTATNGTAGNNESESIDGARRILVLAQEGLDMIHQVTKIVDDTVGSAEDWVQTFRFNNPASASNPQLADGRQPGQASQAQAQFVNGTTPQLPSVPDHVPGEKEYLPVQERGQQERESMDEKMY